MTIITTDNPNYTDNKLTYNFYTIPLNDQESISQNIKLDSTNHYIKITNYPYNGKAAHITHDILGASTSFIVTEMRIYKGFYNNAVLQLVIETSSNKNELTYICIPLKSGNDNSTPNDLDNAIRAVCSNDNSTPCPQKLNLNNLIIIPQNIYFTKKSDNSSIFDSSKSASSVHIVIFGNEIKLTQKTLDTATSVLGNIPAGIDGGGGGSGDGSGDSSGSTYNVIQSKNITSPNNLSDANIYIDCDGDDTDVTVPGGSYKLKEKDIKQIFYCIFIGLVFILFFYVADALNANNDGTVFRGMFKKIHDLYDEKNNSGKFMLGLIVVIFIICFSLYTASFFSKKDRVSSLISALYFTMFLFLLIYVKFLKSVTKPIDTIT